MIKKIGVSILIVFLALPLVLGLKLDLTIKSYDNDGIDLRIQNNIDGTTFSDGNFLGKKVDSEGKVYINYTSTHTLLKLSIIARASGSGLAREFNGVPLIFFKNVRTSNKGETVFIDLTQASPSVEYRQPPEPEPEPTVENETSPEPEPEPETTPEPPPETPAETSPEPTNGGGGFPTKLLVYGIIILAVIIVFPIVLLMIMKKINSNKSPKKIKVTKLSSSQQGLLKKEPSKPSDKPQTTAPARSQAPVSQPSKVPDDEEDRLIRDAEERIRLAQEEINKLKNKRRIREAEKKLAADQAELARLRSGQDSNIDKKQGGDEFEERLQKNS
jgi:hypothetical protein